MTANSQHFKEFKAHTLLKHRMLRGYVMAWIQILKRRNPRLWIIDGFAGKGKDDQGTPGSPLHLARAAAELSTDGATVRLIAIEKHGPNFKALKQNLEYFDIESANVRTPVAYLREGPVQKWADEVFAKVGEDPTFVFLDPFGVAGLELKLCERTLALPKGEVFVLFSETGVVRGLGVMSSARAPDRPEAPSPPVDLFPGLPSGLDQARRDAALSEASLEATNNAIERHLPALFGDQATVDALLRLPPNQWGRAAVQAYVEALRRCGATHVTPIAVFDNDDQQAYYLVHAAKDPLATVKMKEAYNAALNATLKESNGQATLFGGPELLVSDAVSIDVVAAAVEEHFAGWGFAEWGEPTNPHSVVGFALANTPMFNSQKAALKDRLMKTAKIETTRPLVFSFPRRPAPEA